MNKNDVKISTKPFILNVPDVETGGCSIIMIGSGRSGKTTALKYIIDNYFQKHCGVLFSQSAKSNAYKDMNYPMIPLSSVYIPEIVNTAYRINRECKNEYPFLFILDDCPLDKNSKELLKTFTIYRNQNISGFLLVQTPTLINPTNRSNSTFTLLFKCNASEQIEAVCKFYLRGYFPNNWSMNERVQWYKQATENHFFIFIDNYAGTISRCKLNLE